MLYQSRKVYILSFTKRGADLGDRVCRFLLDGGADSVCCTLPRFCEKDRQELPTDKKQWVGDNWGKADFIFIGAAGIAVRYIAPWLKDKFTDSAVLVLDEAGQFVIPLLSGHVGGAVETARALSLFLDARCVVTTATDVNGRFAVDVFAKENGLVIMDKKSAKEISAAVLSGEKIGLYCESSCRLAGKEWETDRKREVPDTIICSSPEEINRFSFLIWVTDRPDGVSDRTRKSGYNKTLLVLATPVAAGIGCRRDTPFSILYEQFVQFMKEKGFDLRQVRAVASIDLKKDEEGLIRLADALGVPFFVYPADELAHERTESEPSSFVSSVTGVDNVCERAARRCAASLIENVDVRTGERNVRLLEKKHKMIKMTVAIVAAI